MRAIALPTGSRSGKKPARRRGGWILLFAVAFVAGLLIFAPAALIGSVLEMTSSGRVLLTETDGTLWAGRGRLLFAGNGGIRLDAGHLSWRLDKTAILRARLQWRLEQELAGQTGRALVAFSPASTVRLADAEIVLPADLLTGLSPAWAALGPRGTLRLSSPGFVLQDGRYTGNLSLVWAPAIFWGDIAAGDYQLKLHGRGTPDLEGEVTTLRGAIVVQGEGSLNRQGKLKGRADIRLQPGPESGRAEPLFRTLCASGRQACRFSFD